MRYGDLEQMLVEQTGGDQRSVLGRFRNLRQMPFPDAIRTGTGNKVEYDLPRVIALCVAFELGAMMIPQSQAVAIVRDTWPEIIRGFIAAAVELGLMARPGGMPADATALVKILPDGFAPSGGPAATASGRSEWDGGDQGTGASVHIDCEASLSSIRDHVEEGSRDSKDTTRAFADLDRTFGWSKGVVPHRASARDLFDGTSFLDRGPYLERATAFLRIAVPLPGEKTPLVQRRRRSRRSAQNLLDYLGRPSPIDAWKGEIGTEDGRPRLKHLLAAVGEAVGLDPVEQWPATILGTTTPSPAEEASALIERVIALEKSKRSDEVMAAGS